MAVLAAFTSGVKIQCGYRSQQTMAGDGEYYVCDATAISVENPTKVTDVSGTQIEGKTNADVKGFYMASQTILTEVPKGIEKFFPNLQDLVWGTGIITKINSTTLKPFPNLWRIVINGNRIETLDGDLFKFSRRLQYVDFSSNRLQHVGHGVMTGLNNLTYATFQSNPCTNSFAYSSGQSAFAVQTLNLDLPIICPPLAATPPSTCCCK